MRWRTKLCFSYRLSHTYLLLFSKIIMNGKAAEELLVNGLLNAVEEIAIHV